MKTDSEKNDDSKEKNSMDKLEEALLLCGFGRFHILLLLATLFSSFASTMVTTTSSYILPIAECDLGMSIMGKGFLSAMPFLGQVGASLVTGFITDAFGRKIFLVSGHIGIFVCTILEGSSQNYWVLITGKFAEGIFLSVTLASSSVMLSELTHKKARDRVLVFWTAFMSLSMIMAALTSWAILPLKVNFVILPGYFELKSWNIYLYVSSIWGLLAGLIYFYLPESPKFLLSKGHQEEALEILKKVYEINTGKNKESFPIASLQATQFAKPSKNTSFNSKITEGLFEAKNLFRQPLLTRLILFLFINVITMFSYTSIRMWYPQISTVIENYESEHGGSADFCVMIDDYTHGLMVNNSKLNNVTEDNICVPHLSGVDTYINGIILGAASFLSLGLSTYLVKYLRQKTLMTIALGLCAACSTSLYWTNSLMQVAILLSASCAFMHAVLGLLCNLLVRGFPTSLRTLTFSIFLMVGRIGSLTGSILFPVMLQTACMSPFFMLSVVCLCVLCLVWFLPDPDKENNGTGDK